MREHAGEESRTGFNCAWIKIFVEWVKFYKDVNFMYKIGQLIKNAEEELQIIKKFCSKYNLQVNYVKFFEDRLHIPLRSKKQENAPA